MRTPANWAEGRQVRITETPVTADNNILLLPQTLPSSGDGVTSNSNNRSAFFTEEIQAASGKAYLQLGELSSSGDYYNLTIQVPEDQMSTLKKVAASLQTPPVATATDVVNLMKKNSFVLSSSQVGTDDQWILTGGNPATAQEEFALYRSTNGGHTWTLERFTSFQAANDFMGLVGVPTIFFWTSQDGIIAESSGVTPSLLVYRTTDGGKTWATVKVSPPHPPTGGTAPTVSQKPNGALEISVPTQSGTVFRALSTDGGETWSPDN